MGHQNQPVFTAMPRSCCAGEPLDTNAAALAQLGAKQGDDALRVLAGIGRTGRVLY